MQLFENERVDEVNDSLSLIQKTDGLTFGTDALLLAAYVVGRYKVGVEIGTGSGIISMLLLTRNKIDEIYAVEVQEEYARLTERNATLNRLEDRLHTVHSDVRSFRCECEADILFTNPPYMKTTSGKHNLTDSKTVARHEVHGDIEELLVNGAKNLKYGASLYVVYRPDRLIDLIAAMRSAGCEPKRMTFVHASLKKEPSMVLVEAKKGGKPSILVTRPLIIYKDDTHREYTDDMNYIMENGSFAPDFKR